MSCMHAYHVSPTWHACMHTMCHPHGMHTSCHVSCTWHACIMPCVTQSDPDSRSDPNGGYEPSPRRETIYRDSLPALSDVGMSKSYNCFNISYTKLQNKTTTVVVFIVPYTTMSLIYIYKTIHYIYMIRARNL